MHQNYRFSSKSQLFLISIRKLVSLISRVLIGNLVQHFMNVSGHSCRIVPLIFIVYSLTELVFPPEICHSIFLYHFSYVKSERRIAKLYSVFEKAETLHKNFYNYIQF